MSGKNQFPVSLGPLGYNLPGFGWQSTNPAIGFLPLNNNTVGVGSASSGVLDGVMSGTNTIYTQILDVSRMDNIGLEVNWTGAPTGTFSVMASDSGTNFHALTFDPMLAQPAGAAGGYVVDLNQYPWKYLMLQYTNTSGSGILTVFGQLKDLN